MEPIRSFAGEVRDGRLWGRGAADMKGGNRLLCAAAGRFVRTTATTLGGSISLLITGDEEGPAVNGTRKVLDVAGSARRADRHLPGRRADQSRHARRDGQDRPARQPERPDHGTRRAGPQSPIRISPTTRLPAWSPVLARLDTAAARCRLRLLSRHRIRGDHRSMSAIRRPMSFRPGPRRCSISATTTGIRRRPCKPRCGSSRRSSSSRMASTTSSPSSRRARPS